MEEEFRTIKELYQRIYPALRTKKHELTRLGFDEVLEEDVWNYLKEYKWNKGNQLTLSDMVDDILNTDNREFVTYIKEAKRKITVVPDLGEEIV